MARVLIRTQSWGTVQDRHGEALPSLTYALKNTDGSAATHWSAQTGGSSSTATLTTDSFGVGTLSGADRWVEQGEYDLVTNGNTYRVEALNAASVASVSRLSVMSYGAVGDGVTDDTTAIQNAINAAATIATSNGKAAVVFPPGYAFYSGQLLAKSGVSLLCDGAVIMPKLASIPATQGMIFWQTGVLTDFDIYGGYWKGTGSETNTQTVFYTGSNGGLQDCRFERMRIDNWGVMPLYMRNPTRVAANFNNMRNPGVGAQSAYNAINFVFDGAQAFGGKITAIGNIIDGAWGGGICAVVSSTSAGSVPMYVVFADNITSGYATSTHGNSGAISFEIDVGVADSRFIAHDNIITAPVSYGMLIGAGSAGVAAGQRVLIHHNDIDASAGGATGIFVITTGGSPEVGITDNRINAPTPITQTGTTTGITVQRGNRFSAGVLQGRATLVAGTVTVNTAEVVASDNITLTRVVTGGTVGHLSVGTITAGTSFVINSSSGTDTSTVFWQIVH